MGVDKNVDERKKRFIISIRTTGEIRQRLEHAAELTGRSLTQELESRIEGSFRNDDEVLGLGTTTLLKLIGTSIRAQEALSGQAWDADQRTRAAMIETVVKELKAWTGPKAAWRRLSPERSVKIWPKEAADGAEI